MTRNPLIDPFLRQTARLERRVGGDAYSGTTYSDDPAADTWAPGDDPLDDEAEPRMIAVRWFTEERVIRMDDGREVVSGAYISAAVELREGDRVTDEQGRPREIIRVRFNRDVTGRGSHYIGWLA